MKCKENFKFQTAEKPISGKLEYGQISQKKLVDIVYSSDFAYKLKLKE